MLFTIKFYSRKYIFKYITWFFKSTEIVFNLSASNSFSVVFKLFKLVIALTNLLMCKLSTSAFKAVKSTLAAELDVLTPATSFNFF